MRLTNKQEKFALLLFKGISQYEAWGKAGYSTDYDRGIIDVNAWVLANSNKVQLRLTELRAKVNKDAIMNVEERQERLTEIARARLVEFQDDKGHPKLDKSTPNNAAAREFYHKERIDRGGNPVVTKSIKLTDPIEAIRELNKMDGSYAPSKHLIAKRVQFDIQLVERPKLIEGGKDAIQITRSEKGSEQEINGAEAEGINDRG